MPQENNNNNNSNNENNEGAEEVPLTNRVSDYLLKKLKWNNLTAEEKKNAEQVIARLSYKIQAGTKPFTLKLPPVIPGSSGGRRTRKGKRQQKKRKHTRRQ